MKSGLRVVADAAALARAGAAEVLDGLGAADRKGRPFRIALSGGQTPRGVYEALAAAGAGGAGGVGVAAAGGGAGGSAAIPWRRAEIFFGDERHVPPDHPDSNYRMAREALLSRVPVPDSQIHRVPAELPDAEEAATEYERTIRAAFGLAGAGALPRFDLVLLGLGADGHTASLFPGSPALEERRRLVAAPWVESQRTHRITLTLPVLNAAARVLFLVSGADKAATLRAVLEERDHSPRLPAQLVRPTDGSLLWIADREAAARLDSGD